MESEAGGVARGGAQGAGRRAARAVRVPAGRWFWPRWVVVSAVARMGELAVVAEALAYGLGVSPSDPSGWSVAWAVLLGGLLCGATLWGVQ